MGYRTPGGRPLDGVRVIDTSTGPAGGVAPMVLADFGAVVIKVEPPGGDRCRSLAASPLWLRGKRSVVLNLHTDSGSAHLQDLVRTADVLVTGGPPARSARWGVDYAANCETTNQCPIPEQTVSRFAMSNLRQTRKFRNCWPMQPLKGFSRSFAIRQSPHLEATRGNGTLIPC